MTRKILVASMASMILLTACASTPTEALPALTQARATHKAVCGEVLRLQRAGVQLPAARSGCISADEVLDGADVAYRLGNLAQASSGATRAMVYIAGVQAILATQGSVK